MKKPLFIGIFILVMAIGGFITFLLMTDKLMVRLPVLVHNNPKVTFFIGKVTYREDESSEWTDVKVGMRLGEGSEIKTGKKSLVDISFHEKTAIRMVRESHLQLKNLDIKKMSLLIKRGNIYGKFSKIFKNHEIEIHTPTSVAAVRGTDLGFEVSEVIEPVEEIQPGGEPESENKSVDEKPAVPELLTTVYAMTGITEVYNPDFKDQRVLLSYQQKVQLKKGEPVGAPGVIKKKKLKSMRKVINLIHEDEVLLISNKILFKSGSSKMLKSSEKELDKIAEVIKDKDVKVRIDGHTDSISTPAYNYNLSVQRAKAIRLYLVKKGLSYKKLKIKGYGESNPVADNSTAEGRATNRRVEFIIIE